MLLTQQGICTTFPFLNQNIIFSKILFFLSTSKWNKLDPRLRNSESFLTYKKNILQFIRPTTSSVYNCHNPKGIKLITRFHLYATKPFGGAQVQAQFPGNLKPFMQLWSQYGIHNPFFSPLPIVH